VESADLVIRSARVFTPNPTAQAADAVAVRAGRILAVGPADRIGELVGPHTRVVNRPGGMVVPGFQDSHIHPDGGGLVKTQCELHELRGADAYIEALRRFAESHPDREWIIGDGWTLPDFPGGTPHRTQLDSAVSDRPAYVENRDGHGAWVNSRALELAGVGPGTPDPPDGRIERDEDGSPSGMLHEGAMKLVSRLIPPPTPRDLEQALLISQAYLHSLGVTAWQDAHVSPETLAAYLALEGRGELTARVVGALWWDRTRGLEQIDDLRALRAEAPDGRVRATSVKIMQDGICENFTAAMIEPYLEPEDRRGLSFVEPDLLNLAVTSLDAEGFQVHVHAIGDRAVREALDAVQAAREANRPSDLRHHIAHIQVVHPDDVPRFASLGVVANCQPHWACLEEQMRDLCLPILGAERTAHQYPFAGLLRAGATLAFGSDWPVTTPDPMKEIQVAVTRVPDGEPDVEPFLPHERVTLEEALDAFTMGSAFVNHLESEAGSIETGKAADLAVLDRNPFDVDPLEIGACRVLMTLVDGQPVFVDPEVGW
jgi:predicted amidohydrolase YtcJ